MIDPNALKPHYSRFLREGTILLTGHSHQAWPDVARDGLLESFDDAARYVDAKWERAMEAAEHVREAVAARIGASTDEIALGGSTHELVTRFLSALDLRARPHVVTTSGEFHSMHRQLKRLSEVGIDATFVPVDPIDELPDRLVRALRDDTAAMMVSTVLFETSAIVPDLAPAIAAARARGVEVLLDAYHAFGVVPFTAPDGVLVTAGGYKYAQWGEGCCFLRVPRESRLEPVYTGWFSDFANLAARRGAVTYGPRPADRFAGSTYDPASHYRARAVVRFFEREGLSIDRLRELSLAQTSRVLDRLDGYRVLTPREPGRRGGFVAIEIENAAAIVRALAEKEIHVDARGSILRIGPAPYVTMEEIDRALDVLRTIAPPAV